MILVFSYKILYLLFTGLEPLPYDQVGHKKITIGIKNADAKICIKTDDKKNNII